MQYRYKLVYFNASIPSWIHSRNSNMRTSNLIYSNLIIGVVFEDELEAEGLERYAIPHEMLTHRLHPMQSQGV